MIEGKKGSVCLLLIGYDPFLIGQFGFEQDLVTSDVFYIRGGHDISGNELAPLDERAVREAVLARRGFVDAFAVSGYFGVRNPAHELRARAIIEELAGSSIPVSCGHALTINLDSIRRATTAVLNAQLIPLLISLIKTVRQTLDRLHIKAPLMIVKGDGSLISAEWALARPIETIISGPAASVVGACHLTKEKNFWVVDMGGTTTDIAMLHDGRPRLSAEGACIGKWRTMVETASIFTIGLGGDSCVALVDGTRHHSDNLKIGPSRVVPLCVLASQYPRVLEELRDQVALAKDKKIFGGGEFIISNCSPSPIFSEQDKIFFAKLNHGPISLRHLREEMNNDVQLISKLKTLDEHRVVLRAGFTPTDALHALGIFDRWDAEASRLGSELLALKFDLGTHDFCEKVVSKVSRMIAQELINAALIDENVRPQWDNEKTASWLIRRSMSDMPKSLLDCKFVLSQPIVAVGAPIEAYLPMASRHLNTDLIIPLHAEVANAIGAIVGSVVQRLKIIIRSLNAYHVYRAHLIDEVYDSPSLEQAIAYVKEKAPPLVIAMANKAGASQVEVEFEQLDYVTPPSPDGYSVHAETELIFTAVGRPSIIHDGVPE